MYLSSLPKKTYTKEEWDERLDDVKILKEEVNKLVMDYFLAEDLVNVAKAFSEGSGTENVDLDIILDKLDVVQKIRSHNAEGAIEKLKALGWLGLLDPDTVVMLKCQVLCQLIVDKKVEEALQYSKDRISPWVEQFPQYAERMTSRIEPAMLSLVLEDPTDHLDGYLNDTVWLGLARLVNAEILRSQNREKEARLIHLLKTLFLVQNELDVYVQYPRWNVSCCFLEDSGSENSSSS